jgi:hypothetical protein
MYIRWGYSCLVPRIGQKDFVMPCGVEDPVSYRGVVGFVRCASPTERAKL